MTTPDEPSYECPTCGARMTGYTASLSDETRPGGYYAEPCGHRILVFHGAQLYFKTFPEDWEPDEVNRRSAP